MSKGYLPIPTGLDGIQRPGDNRPVGSLLRNGVISFWNEEGEPFCRCGASRGRGTLSVLLLEISLPEALPHTGRLPALRVAPRNGRSVRDGNSSRAVLRRLLLALDGAFVRRRRDEHSMARRACALVLAERILPGALEQARSGDRTRSLRWRLGRRIL